MESSDVCRSRHSRRRRRVRDGVGGTRLQRQHSSAGAVGCRHPRRPPTARQPTQQTGERRQTQLAVDGHEDESVVYLITVGIYLVDYY